MRQRIKPNHVAKALPNGELRIYSRKQRQPYVTIFGKTIAVKSGTEHLYKGFKIEFK